MASFMSMLGRTFGTVADVADTISTGVSHLNSRMQRYAENNLRLAEDQSAIELARARKELNQEMVDLTKAMDTIASDPVFERSQTWFSALKQEINGGEFAKFPALPVKEEPKQPSRTVTVRRGKQQQ